MREFYFAAFRKYPLWTIGLSVLVLVLAVQFTTPFATLFFVFVEFKYHLGLGHFISFIVFGLLVGSILGTISARQKLNIGSTPYLIPLIVGIFFLVIFFAFHDLAFLARNNIYTPSNIATVTQKPVLQQLSESENQESKKSEVSDSVGQTNENQSVEDPSTVESDSTLIRNEDEENGINEVANSENANEENLTAYNEKVVSFVEDANTHDIEKVLSWFSPFINRYYLKSNLTKDDLRQEIQSFWEKNDDELHLDSFQAPYRENDKIITISHGIYKNNQKKERRIKQEIHFDQNEKIIFVRAHNL